MLVGHAIGHGLAVVVEEAFGGFGTADDPTLEERFLKGIPIGRLGQPRDIMGLALLLASDASEWITGAIIPMDGGNLAMNAGGTPGHQAAKVQSFHAESKNNS